MAQLKMFWNVTECDYPENYDGFSYRRFDGSEKEINEWVEICKYGLASPEDGREYFDNTMLSRPYYKPSDTFFVIKDGEPVATVTAIVNDCEDSRKLGYVHMVAAKDSVRGKGLGSYMTKIAKAEFYARGCYGAYLTTDEFRVPAVRCYLNEGFNPVEYDEGMERRWVKWLSENEYHNVDYVDEQGQKIKTLLPNPVKIGIFGARRGEAYACCVLNSRGRGVVTCVCDMNTQRLETIKRFCNESTKYVTDFDELLNAGCDAIILCNYFNEHAKFAVKCLERGINVLSETTACVTMKECVELVEASEKSGAVYMLAENCAYMYQILELKKLYEGGTLGKAVYTESEYIHPMSPEEYAMYTPNNKHWRAQMPSCYYHTHSLAPVMNITGAYPTAVNARAIFTDAVRIERDDEPVKDVSTIMLCQMSDSSLCRITGWAKFATHGDWCRISCGRGSAESVRGNEASVMVSYNGWQIPEGHSERVTYDAKSLYELPEEKECDGHYGGDYKMILEFLDCVINGKKPLFDVYNSVRMSAVAILAWRSCLENGKEYIIPDFKNKEERDAYRNDDLSPFADESGKANYPCTITK